VSVIHSSTQGGTIFLHHRPSVKEHRLKLVGVWGRHRQCSPSSSGESLRVGHVGKRYRIGRLSYAWLSELSCAILIIRSFIWAFEMREKWSKIIANMPMELTLSSRYPMEKHSSNGIARWTSWYDLHFGVLVVVNPTMWIRCDYHVSMVLSKGDRTTRMDHSVLRSKVSLQKVRKDGHYHGVQVPRVHSVWEV